MAKKTISERFELIPLEYRKIMIGALMAAIGAALTYALQELSKIDYGMWTPIITALMSILANVIRKWISTTQY